MLTIQLSLWIQTLNVSVAEVDLIPIFVSFSIFVFVLFRLSPARCETLRDFLYLHKFN